MTIIRIGKLIKKYRMDIFWKQSFVGTIMENQRAVFFFSFLTYTPLGYILKENEEARGGGK